MTVLYLILIKHFNHNSALFRVGVLSSLKAKWLWAHHRIC